MTVFSLAYYLIVILMLILVVRSISTDKTTEELAVYYNLSHSDSKFYHFFIWSIYASVAVFLVSFAFPPLVLLLVGIKIVSNVIAWFWLYESYSKGFITVWYNDLKATFNK